MNCRRTSSIIWKAARPTARMAIDENRNGIMAPSSRPPITFGSPTSIVSRPTVVRKAENRASAVSAAEPIAKPLPMAAVVLPTASSLSVRARTSAPRRPISAMPPALSATGP